MERDRWPPELVRLSELSDAERLRLLSKSRTYYQLFDGGGDEWPLSTEECCRWCIHPFSTFPIGIPVRHDDHIDKMILSGYYCSFACAAAHCRDAPQHFAPDSSMTLRMLASRCFRVDFFVPAPPREMLSFLSIEEFRKLSAEAQWCFESSATAALLQRQPLLLSKRSILCGANTVDREALEAEARGAREAQEARSAKRRKRTNGETELETTSSLSSSGLSTTSSSTLQYSSGNSHNHSLITLMPHLTDIDPPQLIADQNRQRDMRGGIMGMLYLTKKK
jgi:hypothetical protein